MRKLCAQKILTPGTLRYFKSHWSERQGWKQALQEKTGPRSWHGCSIELPPLSSAHDTHTKSKCGLQSSENGMGICSGYSNKAFVDQNKNSATFPGASTYPIVAHAFLTADDT
jgi:hypothetical protein